VHFSEIAMLEAAALLHRQCKAFQEAIRNALQAMDRSALL
jgi:hypothetical protein